MKKQARSCMVTLRMTPENNALIEKAALESHRTKSEMITYATMMFLAQDTFWATPLEQQTLNHVSD